MADQGENPACATGKIRLYVEAALASGGAVELGRDQTHYLVNVMRRGAGDGVLLFNGRDGEWLADIDKAGKKTCTLKLRTRTRVQDTVPDLQLWFAPVKRAPTDFIVQKATELGIAAIRPVTTKRTNVARVRADRLRATVIEAAEQCGRLTVPEVLAPATLEEALAQDTQRRVMFCDEGGDVRPAQEALAGEARGPWAVLTGPEGGFDAQERAMLRAQDRVVPVSLGPRIMRADTAAVAALTLWQAALGDW
jgi:16S rRNA (uracil1498-N3)-methyltransferase